MATNGALVRIVFPSDRLGRAIGHNAVVVAIASAPDPSVAAGIPAATSWRWLFAINVPLGITSLVLGLGLAALPASTRLAKRLDCRSALLNAAFAGLFVAANDLADGHGTFWNGWH